METEQIKKLPRLVIATHNPAKLARYQTIAAQLADEVLGLDDLGVEGKPEETGETSEENARIKAEHYAQACGCPVFCEDESLHADFLSPERQPGTHVRRINGKDDVTDDELFAYWEKIVKNVGENKRSGHWHVAYCLCVPGRGTRVTAIDHPCRFYYPASQVRIPGWPMSSLQGPACFDVPNSEVTAEDKVVRDAQIDEEILAVLKEMFV